MRKVEHYICEVCGTEYKDKAGMSVTIEVEVKDGKETRRATYKR